MAMCQIVGLAHLGDLAAEKAASRIEIGFAQHKMPHALMQKTSDLDGDGAAHAVAEKIDGLQLRDANKFDDRLSVVGDAVSEFGRMVAET